MSIINKGFRKVLRYLTMQKRRRKLRNHKFSIICNTCIGGVISNSLGEQFRSPTVNLVIYEYEFITFCQHLKEYSECDVELPTDTEKEQYSGISYPVGILRGGKKNLPDITLYFVHYHSFNEARNSWIRRFKRVNYDDIFLLMDRGMDAKDDVLDLFHQLPYKNKVFFTHRENKERWPNTFRMKYYTEEDYVVAYMYEPVRRGLLEYRILDEFDYTAWLNDGVIQSTNLSY